MEAGGGDGHRLDGAEHVAELEVDVAHPGLLDPGGKLVPCVAVDGGCSRSHADLLGLGAQAGGPMRAF